MRSRHLVARAAVRSRAFISAGAHVGTSAARMASSACVAVTDRRRALCVAAVAAGETLSAVESAGRTSVRGSTMTAAASGPAAALGEAGRWYRGGQKHAEQRTGCKFVEHFEGPLFPYVDRDARNPYEVVAGFDCEREIMARIGGAPAGEQSKPRLPAPPTPVACRFSMLSMANCQIGLSAAVFEVLIPLPECATSLSYSFI